MADEVFDWFDHAQYRDEVIERWGRDAYESGDSWWRTMSEQAKQDFGQRHLDIAADYGAAYRAGLAPDSPEVLAIAQRHYDWIAIGWQGRRPTAGAEPAERPISPEAFTGLGEMYVTDPRFRANYDVHGEGTTEFVRDAMVAYALAQLT